MKIEEATGRREFLAAALAVPAAAVAGAASLRTTDAAPGGAPREAAAGYRETAHVLAYYDTTRL